MRLQWIAVIVASVLASIVGCGGDDPSPQPSPQVTAPLVSQVPAESRFGVHLAGNAQVSDAQWVASVPAAGASWFRFNVVWNHIERTEGNYDWSVVDAIVQEATRHNVSLLLQLRGYGGGNEA